MLLAIMYVDLMMGFDDGIGGEVGVNGLAGPTD